MANVRSIMKKLQTAIAQRGMVVKINTYQFFSDDQKRFINMYVLVTPAMQLKKSGEWAERDYEIIRSSSVLDVLDCLKAIHEAVKR